MVEEYQLSSHTFEGTDEAQHDARYAGEVPGPSRKPCDPADSATIHNCKVGLVGRVVWQLDML